MRIRTLLAAIVAALALTALAPTATAAAPQREACGWTGNVAPLIRAADRKVVSLDLTRPVTRAFGPGARVTRITRLELDLRPPAGASPTRARGLTSNAVVYRLTVSVAGSDDQIAAVTLRYDGLCYRTRVFMDRSWVGTIGFEVPTIDAERALRLAQGFRREHSDVFPLDNPLAGMELMRATTRPPDFGKLRWFVDYQVTPGVTQTLAVYMNGRVSIAVR